MNRLIFFLLTTVVILVLFEFSIPKFQKKSESTQIQGIILPHHGLAKEILNNSFARLKENLSPKTIVIYGTNHYLPISPTYTTTSAVKNKYKLENIYVDDKRITGDHSIQTILPYISNYFPGTEVVPIIVSTKYQSILELNNIIKNFIQAFGNKDTLYIASVDFAHNVTLAEGLNKNNESIKSISTFNYNEILGYHDDHMDSPLAIITLMLTMQDLGTTNWQTWYSSHGALITNIMNLEGTSYVVGTFSKPNPATVAGQNSSYK